MPGGTRGFDPRRLRALRRQRGLTQADLAEQVGVRRTYFIRWEREDGRGTTPSPKMLCRLADALGVEPWQLTTVEPTNAMLSDLRTWSGHSQPDLADELGVPETSLSAVERGQRPLGEQAAEALAGHLGVPIGEIRAAYERARLREAKDGA